MASLPKVSSYLPCLQKIVWQMVNRHFRMMVFVHGLSKDAMCVYRNGKIPTSTTKAHTLKDCVLSVSVKKKM